jgi:hypothetical protein
LTSHRAIPGWPGTRPFHREPLVEPFGGADVFLGSPIVYSGTLLMGQLSKWSLLNITTTSGRAAWPAPHLGRPGAQLLIS